MPVIHVSNHITNISYNFIPLGVCSWGIATLTKDTSASTLMEESLFQDVVFNENHFPFHDGFLDTRNPLKSLTEITPIVMPSFPTGITGSNTIEPTNVNYQEIEDQPVLGENSMNADEAISIENEGEDVESTELVEPSNQITPDDNQPAQQDNTNFIRTRSMA